MVLCSDFPSEAAQYDFQLYFEGTDYKNSWPFYIFPASQKLNTQGIYISEEWNEKTDSILNHGGKVLLLANKLGTKEYSHSIYFTPLFWSSSFFPGQKNETLGSLIDTNSHAFDYFPTGDFTNWQWYRVSSDGRYFDLTDLPSSGHRPLVQPISDFHSNKLLGSIFESRIGKGKLLVCGYDLTDTKNEYSQQLLYSLTAYMQTTRFNPSTELPVKKLKELLQKVPVAENHLPLPNEFSHAILFLKAGANAKNKASDWERGSDSIIVKKGVEYAVSGASIEREGKEQGWDGKAINIHLEPPNGIKGFIYLHFSNRDNTNMSGSVILDGRELKTGKIPTSGKWIKIGMMREDTNDGKVDIKVTSENNEPVQIDQLVMVSEE